MQLIIKLILIMIDFRSNCPICSTLDIIGDKWSLIVVRDMLIKYKSTFKELIDFDEKIATNILSTRLKWLEKAGVLTKQKLPENKKMNIYLLTERGIALTPLIVETIIWSDENLKSLNPEITNFNVRVDNKQETTELIQNEYRKFAKARV
jgi:DNA-binding HxlR family transcriptional regulator